MEYLCQQQQKKLQNKHFTKEEEEMEMIIEHTTSKLDITFSNDNDKLDDE